MNGASKEPARICWGLVIASSAVFVLASLAYVAAGFGDGDAPINRFLNRHGGTVIVVLAGITISNGLLAMFLDQRGRRSTGSMDTRDTAD